MGSNVLLWASVQYRKVIDLVREFFRLGRHVPCDPSLPVLPRGCRTALVCIAKDEDNYIQEWIDYHLALGIDTIYVYQNDWRANVNTRDGRVVLIEFDGSCKQLPAYNDFLKRFHREYDFAAFIDVDEFICLPGEKDLHVFLGKYNRYCAVALNWKIFGDSGLERADGDYSLLRRFVRSGKGYDNHVKVIVNMHAVDEETRFVSPHQVFFSGSKFAVTPDCRHTVVTSYNYFHSDVAWINHYFCKTREEFLSNKRLKGRSDLPRESENQRAKIAAFHEYNQNDVECRVALDFANGAGILKGR